MSYTAPPLLFEGRSNAYAPSFLPGTTGDPFSAWMHSWPCPFVTDPPLLNPDGTPSDVSIQWSGVTLGFGNIGVTVAAEGVVPTTNRFRADRVGYSIPELPYPNQFGDFSLPWQPDTLYTFPDSIGLYPDGSPVYPDDNYRGIGDILQRLPDPIGVPIGPTVPPPWKYLGLPAIKRSPFNFGLPVTTDAYGHRGVWLLARGVSSVVTAGGPGEGFAGPFGAIIPGTVLTGSLIDGLSVSIKYQGSEVWNLPATSVIMDGGNYGISYGGAPGEPGVAYTLTTYIFYGHILCSPPGDIVEFWAPILPKTYPYPTSVITFSTDYTITDNRYAGAAIPPIDGVIPFSGTISPVTSTEPITGLSLTRPDDKLLVSATGAARRWEQVTGLPYNSSGSIAINPPATMLYLTGF